MRPRTETFLRADLESILKGIARAGSLPRPSMATPQGQDYADGFRAALEAVAAALGISLETNASVIVRCRSYSLHPGRPALSRGRSS